jgi:uncharacterized protein
MSAIDPLLPFQGPIKDFIAGTRVPLFVPYPFDKGLELSASLYHARSYMDLSYYREKFLCGEISPEALDESIDRNIKLSHDNEREIVKHALHNFAEIFDEKTFYHAIKSKGLSLDEALSIVQSIDPASHNAQKPNARFLLQKILEAPMDHEVNAILFRLLGAYVDQGVNLWPFLDRYNGFKNAIQMLATKSGLPIAPFVDNRELTAHLAMDSESVIIKILGQILVSPTSYRNFLTESVLDHPGWSGMVNMIAKFPDSLAKRRSISLDEFIAVKLALEWQFIKNKFPNFSPIHPDEINQGDLIKSYSTKAHAQSLAYWIVNLQTKTALSQDLLDQIKLITLQKIWHQALENTYYQEAAKIILSDQANQEPKNTTKTFQAVFCIDDRECSLRRHLENESPEIETFGYAGFFGIDCYFKAHKKDLLDKMCPLPVTPHHVIVEKANKEKAIKDRKLAEFASFISLHGANSIFFGFISAYTIGHLSLFRLILSFLHPFKMLKTHQLANKEKTTLIFERNSDEQKYNELYLGYSRSEMADRVFSVLNNMGLRQDLAPLVFMIAHGSSSVNNPHFAAYDCGACSGRPGAINARVFASMANLPSVRELVKQKGIIIPDSTLFVGGFHDTCTDNVSFFDTDNLTGNQADLLAQFTAYIANASAKNALERCRKFALVSKNISQEAALAEVNHRSKALFEPRPELGHATNALCIVGRRSRSYLKNLDRRAFLQSYDPNIDESGAILGSLLAAVIPVCGGINLEYMFSRIDPAIHGCGTKLSHNVCSLIGVGNGLDDDLRTGLPIQTTEIHVPVRLLIVIEQKPDTILQAIHKNPNLTPWLVNGWVKVASLDKDSNQMSIFDHQRSQFIDMKV